MPVKILPFVPEVFVDGKWRPAVTSSVVHDTKNQSIWTCDHALEYRLKTGERGIAKPSQWRVQDRSRKRTKPRFLLMCFVLSMVCTLGCGAPAKSSTNPPPPPPPPALPMTGSWTGSMNFTTITANVTLALSQDGSNNLTGAASSTPPLCSFNSQVTGTYFSDGEFQVVSKDGAESFTGTISGDKKSLSGTVQLGAAANTGCGPRLGSFSVGKQ